MDLRLTLVIPSLGPGGAERVLSLLASEWARRDHGVLLVTLTPVGDDFFELDERVERVGLDLASGPRGVRWLTVNGARVRQLRRVISSWRPDVVVSFLDATNLLTLLATRASRVPVIISQRTDPILHDIKRSHHVLRLWLYRHTTAFVVQTDAVATWASAFVPREKVVVIPNPVVLPGGAAPGKRSPTVVGVGRLDKQKGFDLLIEAFAHCAEAYPEWSLTIAGIGPELARLVEQVTRLGLRGRVRFPGLVADPRPLFSESSLFVLSSRSEGLPNVVLEAMASGLPVIAADCSPGLRAIVQNAADGLLVPPDDVDSLAAAMGRLMGDAQERRRLAEAATDVVRRFDLSSVTDRWDTLFDAVLSVSRLSRRQIHTRAIR